MTALACAKMGQRLGGNPLVCGFVGGCAPLLLVPSCMAGGDAPAIALAASGVALAWWQKPLFGGLVAGLSLGVKAIAVPLWLLLPAGLIWSTQKVRFALFLFLGLLPGLFFFQDALAPLLASAKLGLLGSWWLATEGQFPGTPPPRNGMASLQATQLLPTGPALSCALAIWACICKDKALGFSSAEHDSDVLDRDAHGRVQPDSILGPGVRGHHRFDRRRTSDRSGQPCHASTAQPGLCVGTGQLRSQEEARQDPPFLFSDTSMPNQALKKVDPGETNSRNGSPTGQKLPQNSR